MVNVADMTPEQAKEHLLKQQKKLRNNQRKYVKRQLEEGRRRVNTYLSPEAGKVLDDEMEQTKRGAADILSEALLLLARHRAMPTTPSPRTPTLRHVSNPDYNQEATESYIMELHDKGMSQAGIAKQLNEEVWPTQKTDGQWYHKAVGSIIKRRKGSQ